MIIPLVVIVCVLSGKWKCGRAVLLFEILSFRDLISGVVSLLTRPQPVPSARCRGSCPAGANLCLGLAGCHQQAKSGHPNFGVSAATLLTG